MSPHLSRKDDRALARPSEFPIRGLNGSFPDPDEFSFSFARISTFAVKSCQARRRSIPATTKRNRSTSRSDSRRNNVRYRPSSRCHIPIYRAIISLNKLWTTRDFSPPQLTTKCKTIHSVPFSFVYHEIVRNMPQIMKILQN